MHSRVVKRILVTVTISLKTDYARARLPGIAVINHTRLVGGDCDLQNRDYKTGRVMFFEQVVVRLCSYSLNVGSKLVRIGAFKPQL